METFHFVTYLDILEKGCTVCTIVVQAGKGEQGINRAIVVSIGRQKHWIQYDLNKGGVGCAKNP